MGTTIPNVSAPLPALERGRGDALGEGMGLIQPAAWLVRQRLEPLEQVSEARLYNEH